MGIKDTTVKGNILQVQDSQTFLSTTDPKVKAADSLQAEAASTVSPDTLVGIKKVPTSGQSRKARGFNLSKFNANEKAVLQSLLASNGVEATIISLSSTFTTASSKDQARSWTRNALRRLVSEGYVSKPSRGKYVLSDKATIELTKD